jgi:hypothetical protein
MAHSTDGPPDRIRLEITTVPTTSLDIGDAVEFAELLQFVDDGLGTDPGVFGASLGRFVGNPTYGLDDLLAHDLNRFIFLLGGNDGETAVPARPPVTSRAGQRDRGRGCSGCLRHVPAEQHRSGGHRQ